MAASQCRVLRIAMAEDVEALLSRPDVERNGELA